jgi:hypothetical protein
MPSVKVKKRDSDADEVVMVEDAPPPRRPLPNGRSSMIGRQQEQQQQQQANDEGEEGDPVLTAAQRGLTLDTWQDRPVDAQSALQQVRPSSEADQTRRPSLAILLTSCARMTQLRVLNDEYKPLQATIMFTLEQLQDTATSLAEAGIKDDEVRAALSAGCASHARLGRRSSLLTLSHPRCPGRLLCRDRRPGPEARRRGRDRQAAEGGTERDPTGSRQHGRDRACLPWTSPPRPPRASWRADGSMC